MSDLLTKLMTSVLVVVCFRGRFGIKFQKSWGWFIPKIARNKHLFTGQSNQTNKHFLLKLISFNSVQWQISGGQLQNSA